MVRLESLFATLGRCVARREVRPMNTLTTWVTIFGGGLIFLVRFMIHKSSCLKINGPRLNKLPFTLFLSTACPRKMGTNTRVLVPFLVGLEHSFQSGITICLCPLGLSFLECRKNTFFPAYFLMYLKDTLNISVKLDLNNVV